MSYVWLLTLISFHKSILRKLELLRDAHLLIDLGKCWLVHFDLDVAYLVLPSFLDKLQICGSLLAYSSLHVHVEFFKLTPSLELSVK